MTAEAGHARVLIDMPTRAQRGQQITIRVTIAHPMETGYRRSADGILLPRDILRRFRCTLAGATVFEARLFPAIAANPYLAFGLRVQQGGTMQFRWEGDGGFVRVETRDLVVTG